MTVDMGVYSVESFENLTDQDWKGFWKGHAYPAREHRFVVDITLDPCHQMLDIFRCRHLGRSLEILGVLPEIFEFISGFHLRARLWRAELCDGTVKKIDLVIEIDDIDG